MKKIDGVTYLTIGEVAREIGRLPQTIKNWIAWHNEQSEEMKQQLPLPEAITDIDTKGTRYFKQEDVQIFEEFKRQIRYGTMAEFSVTRWGKRGQEIQKKREEEVTQNVEI